MADEPQDKTVINLTSGHEDAERVLIAFLVGTAALDQGRQAVMFLTKEAVRLALPGYADAVEVAGAPPVSKLFAQFADGGGELWACPICLEGRNLSDAELVGNAKVAGATPLWEWIGQGATVFSY